MDLPAPTIKTDSFDHVIRAYLDSADFKELADATRRNYERYLAIVRDKWGALEIKGLEPRHVLALRDRYQTTPATANAIVQTLSALIVWAIPRGHRPDNPCNHIKKLKTGDGWSPWPWEMIEPSSNLLLDGCGMPLLSPSTPVSAKRTCSRCRGRKRRAE